MFAFESKKILLDFKYAKEELDLKKEMIAEIDPLFTGAVHDYLKTNPTLKKQWNTHFDISNEVSTSTELERIEEEEEEIPDIPDFDKEDVPPSTEEAKEKKEEETLFKYIYREIVKKTHPDKISNLSKEEQTDRIKIYQEATKAYESKNLGDLLYCAYLAKVTFKVDGKDLLVLKEMVNQYKQESTFLEQTYSWKWYHADDLLKLMLVERFIASHLSGS